MPKKIVIVGGVGAGMKVATRLRRLDAAAEITVVERGAAVSYSNCGFPYFVGGDVKSYDALTHTPQGILRDAAFFAAVKGVTVLTGHNVERIDRAAKTVSAAKMNGEKIDLPYDYLVLATGSAAMKLPVDGADLNGIHSFWTPTDILAVKGEIDSGKIKDVAVIGAGFIGMEIAESLERSGLNVSVVEMQDRILPQLLDKEIADALLKGIGSSKINIFLNEKTVAFKGENGRVAAVVTDKREIPAQLVIVAIGVRPLVALAKDAGLEIGASGAIAVDAELRTSDAAIFAAGDCAENTHIVSGAKCFAPMGSTANKHGRVVAGVIAREIAAPDSPALNGVAEKYNGILTTGICQIMNWQAGATGLNETTAAKAGLKFMTAVVPGSDRLGYMPGVNRLIVKLLAEVGTERLLGAQVIGTGGVDKRLATIAALLANKAALSEVHNIDFEYAPPFNGPIGNVETAANVLMNKMRGQMQSLNPKEWRDLRADANYTLVDVRTPREFANNRIAGCASIVNLPLGEIRRRAAEVLPDKKAKLVTSCQIDLRGYEAAVILRQMGYENVWSLEGGMSAWPYETERD